MKITDISIFSDGHSIYVITDNNEMLDLLRKGQAVFGISLGPCLLYTSPSPRD